jgi:signal transduction histidine kinase
MKKRASDRRPAEPAPEYPAPKDADELVGTLARHLEDHLGGMQRSARLLNERAAALGDERLGRNAASLLQAAKKMSDFVAEFLASGDPSTPAKFKREVLDLKVAAAAAVRRHGELARRKRIALILVGGPAATLVTADPAGIDQVLANLISNAVKFSPAGKRVWLRVGPAAGSRGRCEVRDEGPGIAAADRRRLFQRYRRLSAQPTGGETSTGLGLSIAKKLAEGMHGTLRCAPGAGPGAAFVLTLPGARRES